MSAFVSVIKQNTWVKELVKTLIGVVLIFACAQISIPLEPVPISLQTMGLMIVAVLYDFRGGLAVVTAYITAGVLGIPVFVGYSFGPGVLFRPTGGYLAGFLFCIYVMNQLKTVLNMNSVRGILINCLAGTAAVFVCGIAWLSYLIGFEAAIWSGFVPFIIPGMIKAIMLTAFLRSLGILRSRL